MIYFLLGFLLIGLVASLPTEADRKTPIIGGDDIDIREVPYQIALFYRGKYICGGTIVDKDIVVTAAHCIVLVSDQAKDFAIRAGSSLRNEGGITVQVADLISHAGFNKPKMDNDIAVMRLAQPLKYGDGVQPVQMVAAGEEIKDGELSLVSGWGYTSKSRDLPSILQGVKVAIANTEECAKAYRQAGLDLITPRMLCADLPGKSACIGDSGGPLVYNRKLAGVVSWGNGCAKPGFPAVYVKVSAQRGWIDENSARLRARQLLRGD